MANGITLSNHSFQLGGRSPAHIPIGISGPGRVRELPRQFPRGVERGIFKSQTIKGRSLLASGEQHVELTSMLQSPRAICLDACIISTSSSLV